MGEKEDYIIKNESESILYEFSYCPDYDSGKEIDVENSILLFLKELNHFPLYLHVISESFKLNVAENMKIKEIKNKHYKAYYISKLIKILTKVPSIILCK